MNYCLTDAYVLKDHQLVKENIWIKNGTISKIPLDDYESFSYPNKIISPGFIDLQFNGAFGIDFTNQFFKLPKVASQLPQYGVTSFLATIVSSSKEHYHQLLSYFNDFKNLKYEGSQCLGIHLEGPFFNPQKNGAHSKEIIDSVQKKNLTFDDFFSFYGTLNHVKMITLAPELPGILDLIPKLKNENRVVVAAGHSLASFEEAKQAFKLGINVVTHLFNAMTPLHQREPGLIGAVLNPTKIICPIFYSLIVDFLHVHPAMIEIAWKVNPEGCFLVSDAIAPMGLTQEEIDKTGEFALGSKKIHFQSKVPKITNNDIIVGGMIPLNQCVKNFAEITKCSIIEALETVTLKPAKILGIDHKKGLIKEGYDADLVILDHNFKVYETFINGKKIFSCNHYSRLSLN